MAKPNLTTEIDGLMDAIDKEILPTLERLATEKEDIALINKLVEQYKAVSSTPYCWKRLNATAKIMDTLGLLKSFLINPENRERMPDGYDMVERINVLHSNLKEPENAPDYVKLILLYQRVRAFTLSESLKDRLDAIKESTEHLCIRGQQIQQCNNEALRCINILEEIEIVLLNRPMAGRAVRHNLFSRMAEVKNSDRVEIFRWFFEKKNIDWDACLQRAIDKAQVEDLEAGRDMAKLIYFFNTATSLLRKYTEDRWIETFRDNPYKSLGSLWDYLEVE